MGTAEAGVVSVPDITETGAAAEPPRGSRQATSAELYARWERQQWSVAEVDPSRDAENWRRFPPFIRDQVLAALAELEVGEQWVTRTLGALVEEPPTDDDRIYLCTQMADEARHVRFFETYIEQACGVPRGEQEAREIAAGADYGRTFAPVLTRATAAARDGGPDAWYRAVVVYHLMNEGVLAAASLRSIRQLAQRLGLTALTEGLVNVIRDESRHVGFGVQAVTRAVADGYGATVKQAHLDCMDATGWVLIGPGRHNPLPTLPAALEQRAGTVEYLIAIARERMHRQLGSIRLTDAADELDTAWDAAVRSALDAYEQRWNEPHALRARAAARQ